MMNVKETSEESGFGLDPETQRALKLWVVLARSFNAVAERLRQDIARFGLNPTEFGVLEILYHKGPLLMGEIGRHVLLTSGSTTYVIDKLEKQGLLHRVACPNDRRAIYAELTEAGRARMEEIFPQHAAIVRETVAGLAAADQETAIRLLRQLGRAVPQDRKEASNDSIGGE